MALSARVKVPLPDHGIIVDRAGKHRYVYKVLRAYRNAKGQPTNDRRSIGRLDPGSGLLIPNDYYWQVYPAAPVERLPAPDAVRSVGAVFLVSQVLEGLGVTRILTDTLGSERGQALTQVACYMARHGNVIDGITDWLETSTLTGDATLTPQAVSGLFASITHAEQMAFFRVWAARQAPDAFLAYDVTSFSTYAKGLDDAEWGHNRDGDKLPQINFGCYLDQDTTLPVFYTTYPGSIIDKSHMAHMMAHNQDLGVTGVTFVLDRGFASTANIAYLHKHKLAHVLGVEIRHKSARHAVDEVKDSITAMRHRLTGGIYAKAVKGRFFGPEATLHIYYDPVLAEQRRSDLARTIQAEADTLTQLNQLTKREAARRRNHFIIDLHPDGSFDHAPNLDKIDAAAGHAGFFAILTNTALTSAEILDVYRRKDTIEKSFDELKNHLDMKRLRTHTDQTTAGKMFCAFIALIATCHIQAKTGPVLKQSKQSISKKGLLAEMDKIKIVEAAHNLRLINPATKLQRDILQATGLTENDLTTYATQP
jgi:hypothetical protein